MKSGGTLVGTSMKRIMRRDPNGDLYEEDIVNKAPPIFFSFPGGSVVHPDMHLSGTDDILCRYESYRK